MLLHYSTVSNSINEYHNFTTIAAATLDMAATSLQVKVTNEEIKATLSVIKSLQPTLMSSKDYSCLKKMVSLSHTY
jgi:2-haloacid dehalogenase